MDQTRKENLSLVFSFLGYAIFGFSFLFSKRALELTTPFVLLAARFTAAFFLMNCLLLTKKCEIRLKGKPLGPLILLGLVQPVCYFICESYGVRLSPTSFVGTVLALVPITSSVFGLVILGEKISRLQAVCALSSVAGVFVTTLGQSANGFNRAGFVLLLGAVCAASLFSVLSRKISGAFGAFERTYVMFAIGGAVFCTVALIQCRNDISGLILAPLRSGTFWISVFYLAGVSSVGAFLMINYAMSNLSVVKVSIFANVTTVISILAGILVLKERFGPAQVAGSAVIIASAYLVNRPPRISAGSPGAAPASKRHA
jgi:drug/metabolite transporter (DMT)-like permease